MINVTDRARDLLEEMLDSNDPSEEQALRLVPQEQGQLSITVDSVQEGDQVIETQERAVLFIPQIVADQLDGATLDATDTDEGPRLSLRP